MSQKQFAVLVKAQMKKEQCFSSQSDQCGLRTSARNLNVPFVSEAGGEEGTQRNLRETAEHFALMETTGPIMYSDNGK